jgi:hypothetical protein
MSAMQFHQRKRIRHAKHDEEQADADPERSGQLLRRFSHAGWWNYTLKKNRRKPRPRALRNHLVMNDGKVTCQQQILRDH